MNLVYTDEVLSVYLHTSSSHTCCTAVGALATEQWSPSFGLSLLQMLVLETYISRSLKVDELLRSG
jgi:hypothetical protein